MKILVVCQYYYPESFQINAICEQLVQDGNTVTVLTGLPNYPTGVIPADYRHGGRSEELINGVHVLRCFEIGRRKSALSLGVNYLSYCISSVYKIKHIKLDADVIYVYQLSPVLMAFPAVVLKKKLDKPLFLYCCDLWPESAKVFLKNEASCAFQMLQRISTWLYQRCDRIAVQSPAFVSYFEAVHSIKPEKLCYIPQFADDAYLSQNFSPAPHRFPTFLFLGNIGIAQDIGCILAAAEHLRETPDFRVWFVGDGSYLETAKRFVRERGLERLVVFCGHHPTAEMPQFYKLADACLLTLKAGNAVGSTIPSKLQGYMAAGKPVLGAIDGPAKEIIREANCGLCVEAGDFVGLAQIMREFLRNKARYAACGERGRAYFKLHFSKERYIRRTEQELGRLLGGNEKTSEGG